MIKTLRITSIIVAIAAVVLLILPVVYGVRQDPKIEEFLKKPGVVEKLTATGGQNTVKKDLEKNPLIDGASGFSKYLNPPPPPQPKPQPGAPTQALQPPAPAPPVASVKFDLLATSYSASNPEKSFILIDEAGKGLHWVKQGSTLGHVTIETIKDGAIVVRDGSRTSEMTVKVKENWRNLLKNPPPTTRTISTSTSPATASVPVSPAVQAPIGRQGVENTPPSPVGRPVQGQPPMPNRRGIRAGAIPSPAERITPSAPPSTDTPAQPALSKAEGPAPAVKATPVPNKVEAPPAETSIPAQAPNLTTPTIELTPEKQAEMDKLISDVAASKVTGDETAQMDKLVEAMKKMEDDAKLQKGAVSSPSEPNTQK
jgi:hypothetical protein